MRANPAVVVFDMPVHVATRELMADPHCLLSSNLFH